jgi:hypothetical protein
MAGLTTRLANEPHRLPAPQQRQTNGNAVGLGVQRADMRRWAERSILYRSLSGMPVSFPAPRGLVSSLNKPNARGAGTVPGSR